MSVTSPTDFTQQPFDFAQNVQPFDPQQGDLGRQHVLYPSQFPEPETPQQLIAAGWTPCPKCGKSWISPENKAVLQASHGYYTCPKCRLTSDLMENLPWHGVEEPDYYPRGNTGGGTSVGLPMDDVGQIAENIVRQMGQIPGYGPITWWHGAAKDQAPLDGATADWGIEVKGVVYDSASHFYHPGGGDEVANKNAAAEEMGLQGVLGIMVLLNFRNDTADVYARAMPLAIDEDARIPRSHPRAGAIKWHKRNAEKIASGIPFESPYKDPAHPAPGPYSMADYYQRPQPYEQQGQADEPMPF